MTATVNLTAVLITFIICLTIVAIMIISKRAEAAERRERNKSKIQQLEIPEFMKTGRKDQAAGLRMIISQEGDIVK